jgi:hypothetical protein
MGSAERRESEGRRILGVPFRQNLSWHFADSVVRGLNYLQRAS